MNALSSQQQEEQPLDSQTQPRIVIPESYAKCYLPSIIRDIRNHKNGYGFFRAPDSVVFFEALGRIGKGEVLRIAFQTKSKATKATEEAGKPKSPQQDAAIKEQVLDELFPEWRTICKPEHITD